MRLATFLYSSLLAFTRKPTTWFIDGNNVLGQKGTTNDRGKLADRIQPIRAAGAESVILVFDGRPGQSLETMEEDNFRQVSLAEGVSTDSYILEEIERLVAESKSNRISVVTADRRLRQLALQNRPAVKVVVNPVTFWKKYIPRMSGLKKQKATAAAEVESN